ncbi:MAG: histidine--tRNA ligase, partial [bacterium]|nr:histidine--tRNA ligase [bacterium]
WQFGFEVLGELSSALDAQVIQIFYNILKELKLKNLVVQVNSIGDSACRPYYKKVLVSYFKTRVNSLCSDCKRRLKENPLRILDCKEEKCQRIVAGSPQIIDHLCEPCHRHFKEVLEFLDEMGLPYHLNPYLVRGLDYYTKTVFEIVEESADGKSSATLAAGGRYDNLIKILGGKDTPSVGGAAGLERIIETLQHGAGQGSLRFSHPSPPQVFIAQLGTSAKRKCLKLIEEFREEGIQVIDSLGRDSLKAQLKIADKEAVPYTLILGQQEVLQGIIIIRDMKNGKQETVKLERAVAEIKKRLRK